MSTNIFQISFYGYLEDKNQQTDVIICVFVCVDILQGSLGKEGKVVILYAMRVLRNRHWEMKMQKEIY